MTGDGTPRQDGWRPHLGRLFLGLLWPPLLIHGPAAERDRSALSALRQIFLAFTASPLLFLVVLPFILPFRDPAMPGDPVVLGLLGASFAALLGALWARNRPLGCGQPAELANAYRSAFFLGIAFANSAALFGFVAAFIAGGWWPYAITLPVGLFGLSLVAPTDGNLDRAQQRLTMGGCPESLRTALSASFNHSGEPGPS